MVGSSTTSLSQSGRPLTASLDSSEGLGTKISAFLADDGSIVRDVPSQHYSQSVEPVPREKVPQDGFADASREPRPDPPADVSNARRHRQPARHRPSHR